jgi:hypothetical protein
VTPTGQEHFSHGQSFVDLRATSGRPLGDNIRNIRPRDRNEGGWTFLKEIPVGDIPTFFENDVRYGFD